MPRRGRAAGVPRVHQDRGIQSGGPDRHHAPGGAQRGGLGGVHWRSVVCVHACMHAGVCLLAIARARTCVCVWMHEFACACVCARMNKIHASEGSQAARCMHFMPSATGTAEASCWPEAGTAQGTLHQAHLSRCAAPCAHGTLRQAPFLRCAAPGSLCVAPRCTHSTLRISVLTAPACCSRPHLSAAPCAFHTHTHMHAHTHTCTHTHTLADTHNTLAGGALLPCGLELALRVPATAATALCQAPPCALPLGHPLLPPPPSGSHGPGGCAGHGC